jgi:hypothetical protein
MSSWEKNVVTVLGVGVMWMDRRPHRECGDSRGKHLKTVVFGNIVSLIVCNTSEYCSVAINCTINQILVTRIHAASVA